MGSYILTSDLENNLTLKLQFSEPVELVIGLGGGELK